MKVRPLKDRDRAIELEEALDGIVMKATARLNKAGFGTEEIMAGLNSVVLARWKLHDEDPEEAFEPR